MALEISLERAVGLPCPGTSVEIESFSGSALENKDMNGDVV